MSVNIYSRRAGALLLATAIAGCTAQGTRNRFERETLHEYKMPDAERIVKEDSDAARVRQEQLRQKLEMKGAPAPALKPALPQFNPLDEVRVNLVVEDAELQHILKALADEAGMNLLLHPNLVGAPYRLSVDFRGVPASKVFEQICKLADVHGYLDGNTLVANPMIERVFQVGFMESDINNTFSAGGDVLGGGRGGANGQGNGGGGGGSQGNQMQGNFSLSGKHVPNSNPYDELETMLKTLIGDRGGISLPGALRGIESLEELGEVSRIGTAIRGDLPVYTLNRMTGTLFVRAKPSVMNTVAELVETYEKILAGQILIDAQLIEVKLNDNFKWGIDWTSLRNQVATAFTAGGRQVTNAAGTFGNLAQNARSIVITQPDLSGPIGPSMSFNMVSEDFSLAANLMQRYGDVAVLSNPTIRSKHGQAAMISVGTSSSYISNTRVVTNGTVNAAVTSQEIQTSQVFDGILIGVVPFVDSNGNITMSVHPVQSKVDPASLQLIDAGNDNRVTLPVVELKSLVTQVKVRSGDAVILGGLIDQADVRETREIPPLGRLPVFGNLFKQRENMNGLRELVLVMKVTLL